MNGKLKSEVSVFKRFCVWKCFFNQILDFHSSTFSKIDFTQIPIHPVFAGHRKKLCNDKHPFSRLLHSYNQTPPNEKCTDTFWDSCFSSFQSQVSEIYTVIVHTLIEYFQSLSFICDGTNNHQKITTPQKSTTNVYELHKNIWEKSFLCSKNWKSRIDELPTHFLWIMLFTKCFIF